MVFDFDLDAAADILDVPITELLHELDLDGSWIESVLSPFQPHSSLAEIGEVPISPSAQMAQSMEQLLGATYGNPEKDTVFWEYQSTEFTCAIQAQRGIIELFTGENVTEQQLMYEAAANGSLTEGGMVFEDIGRLLESRGIGCHSHYDASIEDLMAELASGHRVIVPTDSGELSGEDPFWEDFIAEIADHAIWVTGVNTDDPDNVMVIINDSGDPDGAGKAYPLDQFVDAWKDSGFAYIATDEAPEVNADLPGFDAANSIFTDLVNWVVTMLSESSGSPGVWDYLHSDKGREDVNDLTETISGIAGLVLATDLLLDSLDDLLDDDLTNTVFELL